MRQYFKGYYFKCVEGDQTIALIPACHRSGKKSAASLQVITNDNAYVIPYAQIRFSRNRFAMKMAKNYFSEKGMYLDVDTKGCRIHGKIKFGPFQNIQYDIMGPFRYVPWMQCRHSVISMCHSVQGKIKINEKQYCFQHGQGYIEGDRGCSFPKEYLWTQAHSGECSVMLSVADIPVLGFHLKGIIAVVMIGGKEYRIATYLGARLVSIQDNMVVIKQGSYQICVKLIAQETQSLRAPVRGNMERIIHESASCKAWYQFSWNNRTLLEFTSDNASFENEWHV